MLVDDWRPSACLQTLRARARIQRAIRDFFLEREVLELETPILGPGNVPDPEIEGLRLQANPADQDCVHLQTSPELFMKRFLAAEGVSCFQICRAFRAGERGRRHNPEFTLLEWYRVAWTPARLASEVVELIHQVRKTLHPNLEPLAAQSITYRQLFSDHLEIDPLRASDEELIQLASSHGLSELDREGALAFLMTHQIEPKLPSNTLTIVEDYPANQAALARITTDDDGLLVAERFEIYWSQMELANGYGELTDATEQALRFKKDAATRANTDLANVGSQEQMLDALASGMPECSGVAMGLDRLLMAVLDLEDLGQVVAFR